MDRQDSPALCKLCGDPLNLTQEHIAFHGKENWVHELCHREDTAALKARANLNDKSGEGDK